MQRNTKLLRVRLSLGSMERLHQVLCMMTITQEVVD